jgi:hypothetical protein
MITRRRTIALCATLIGAGAVSRPATRFCHANYTDTKPPLLLLLLLLLLLQI